MITESEIYWITRYDYFQCFSLIVGGLLSIGGLIAVIASVCEIFDTDNYRPIKTALPLFLLFLLVLIGGLFIPSTKEMCAIKVIPMIANNQDIQEIPKQLADLASEWIEELKPNKASE